MQPCSVCMFLREEQNHEIEMLECIIAQYMDFQKKNFSLFKLIKYH